MLIQVPDNKYNVRKSVAELWFMIKDYPVINHDRPELDLIVRTRLFTRSYVTSTY